MKLKNPTLLRQEAFINGQFVAASRGGRYPVYNPYDQTEIATVADCGVEETQAAIAAAANAFTDWGQRSATERSTILKRWYALLLENLDDLATILTMEQGKPLQEARGEIRYGASYVEWFAEEARRAYGDTIPGQDRDKRIIVLKQPVGVVGAITPWNFPNAMIARKVAPALAAGCTVVVKPSELTPLSALALAELAHQAGFPPGSLNIVTTTNAKAIGEELTSNPIVKKISFTGSTEVGKLLMKQSSGTIKKVTMELGGNAPFIVFDDADLDAAVQGAIASKFRNAGQTCVCTNRIFVQEGIYEEFLEKFTAATLDQKIGDGMQEDVSIGPLIEEKAIQFVEDIVADATEKGGRLLTGGKRQGNKKGTLLYEPTVLADMGSEMKAYTAEIFGPVAPVFKFKSEAAAITMANDTPFGLAAYFYGKDHARIWRVAEALEYGMVGINTGLLSTPVAPFGGIKESGIGREGSKYGMEDYLNIKYLCWKI